MEEKGMYGILALVAVFAAAGVFLTVSNSDSGPQVVFVDTGVHQVAAPSHVSLPARIMSTPFKIFGRGVTGLTHAQIGNGSVNFSTTLDLVMNVSIINCTATIDEGAFSAYLNTCNDNGSDGTPNSGGTIVCGDGSNKNTSAKIITCAGGFQLTNIGVEGNLTGLINASSGNFDNLYTYLMEENGANTSCTYTAGTGCVANSTQPVALSAVTESTLCGNFTFGGAVCECMGISLTSLSYIEEAKSGHVITFRKQDTLYEPAVTC